MADETPVIDINTLKAELDQLKETVASKADLDAARAESVTHEAFNASMALAASKADLEALQEKHDAAEKRITAIEQKPEAESIDAAKLAEYGIR